MDRLLVIMLAGSLRPSPLQQALKEHPLALPLHREMSLLDAWIHTLLESRHRCAVRIVVNAKFDAAQLTEHLESRQYRDQRVDIEVVEESSAWRGSGGLLRDIANDVPGEEPVVVTEAACVPPRSLTPALQRLAEAADAVVGAAYSHEPAGVYAFRRSVIDQIPKVGYYDMKEQFIPTLSRSGANIYVSVVGERVIRIRDRRSYLDAVKHVARLQQDRSEAPVTDVQGARVGGVCVLERGVTVDQRVVLQDAVLLSGAVVGRGAVIARSVVGRDVVVDAGARVIDTVVEPNAPRRAVVGREPGGDGVRNRAARKPLTRLAS